MNNLTCFKAYDIRGQVGTQLDSEIAYRIGRAFGYYLSPQADCSKIIAVGGDNRLTTNELKKAVICGLTDSGVNVIDLGLTGTEEVYFATMELKLDGGIEITASHNPIDYNGLKLVREQSKPLSMENGLSDLKQLVEENDFLPVTNKGSVSYKSNLSKYVDHLMTYIHSDIIKPLKLVVNSGNGVAGHVIDELEQRFNILNIPVEFVKVHHEADGNFPNGIPNPLLPECREDTSKAVIYHKADMGIAWDGDFDRCFLFDEKGSFIEGYYVVGLLAKAFLQKQKGEKIIHDPRLNWNTIDIVKSENGTPIESKAGHSYIKERMRKENALYGGEMSAHHYFREFGYCDSGMIPWLLVIGLISQLDKKLSQLVEEQILKYPSSGEINSRLDNPKLSMDKVFKKYHKNALRISHVDGFSLEYTDWRFNLRASNTEPLVRLNVESKANKSLMERMTKEILELLKS